MQRGWTLGAVTVTFLATFFAAMALAQQPIAIADIVERLERTRHQVTTCVGVIKARATDDARSRAQADYANAQALANGVIEGMIAAATDKGDPTRLTGLESKLGELVSAGTGLCVTAQALRSKDGGGKGGVVDAIVGAVLGEPLAKLIEAAKELILDARQHDRERLKTLIAQLERQRWPGFKEIAEVKGE